MKVVIIDGGDGVGKDTLAHILCSNGANGPWVLDHFAVELEERCHGAYKLFTKKGGPLPSGFFEGQKDIPLEFFSGFSARTAYDSFRDYAERTFGSAVLGKWILQRVIFYMAVQLKELPEDQRARVLCIADSAHEDSVKVLEDHFGRENVTFIHMTRPGVKTEFRNGRMSNLPTITVRNDGTVAELEDKIRKAAPGLFIELPRPKTIEVTSEMPPLPS